MIDQATTVSDLSDVRLQFRARMQENDLEGAEALIDSGPDLVPRDLKRRMLAQIRMRQKRHGEVLRLTEGAVPSSEFQNYLNCVRLTGLYGLARYDDLEALLQDMGGTGQLRPFAFGAVIAARVHSERWEAAWATVEAARAQGIDRAPFARFEMLAHLLGDDMDWAEVALGRASETDEYADLASAYLEGCLLTGRTDAVASALPAMRAAGSALSKQTESAFHNLAHGHTAATERVADLTRCVAETATAVVEGADTPLSLEEIYDLTRVLYLYQQSASGAKIKSAYQQQAVERNIWIVPSPNNQPAVAVAINQPPDDTLEALANWAGVDMFRDAWKARVQENVNMEVELTMALHNSEEAFLELSSLINTPDHARLQALAAAGKPAILAATHLGYLSALLALLVRTNMPVSVFGATELDRDLFPGGAALVPTPHNATDAQLARSLLKLLKDDRIIAMAGDIPRGTRSQPFVGEGYEIQMPDSIPQIAFRYGVEVFWICVHWRERALTCALEPLPAPEEGETFEAFRTRWLETYLGKIRDVALADERNVMPFGGIRLPKSGGQ